MRDNFSPPTHVLTPTEGSAHYPSLDVICKWSKVNRSDRPKRILRPSANRAFTECPLSTHFSVFIAQKYEKKLTLKLNITENSVKSLNALKKQHLRNTIFR